MKGIRKLKSVEEKEYFKKIGDEVDELICSIHKDSPLDTWVRDYVWAFICRKGYEKIVYFVSDDGKVYNYVDYCVKKGKKKVYVTYKGKKYDLHEIFSWLGESAMSDLGSYYAPRNDMAYWDNFLHLYSEKEILKILAYCKEY